MKQLIILILLTFSTTLLCADEGFILKERKWTPIYSSDGKQEVYKKLSFGQIDSAYETMNYGKWVNRAVDIQGHFDRESLVTFRLTQDPFPPPAHCQGCVKKTGITSPRIHASQAVVEKLGPGLVRVRGVVSFYPDRIYAEEEIEPFLEIQAEEILVPKSA